MDENEEEVKFNKMMETTKKIVSSCLQTATTNKTLRDSVLNRGDAGFFTTGLVVGGRLMVEIIKSNAPGFSMELELLLPLVFGIALTGIEKEVTEGCQGVQRARETEVMP